MRRDDPQEQFLFHGTRYAKAILAEDRLRISDIGNLHLSVTTNFNVAVYWATLPRDDDEGAGTVFILDRAKFVRELEPLPFVDERWDGDDEHELAVMADVTSLSDLTVAIVPVTGVLKRTKLSD